MIFDLLEEVLVRLTARFDLGDDLAVRRGVEVPEREILEFATDLPHTQAMSDGRVDVQRFLRDPLAPLVGEGVERAHVVQAVGQFDDYDANVVHHRQQHFPDAFGLALLTGIELHLAQFGDAVHAVRDFVAELLPDVFQGADGILDHVMQQARFEAYEVHVHFRERQGDVQRMDDVRLARIAVLALMASHGEPVSLFKLEKVLAGARCPDLWQPRHGRVVQPHPERRARYRRLDGLAGLGCHK